MPDAPKHNFQPLSASERGTSSIPAQTPLQTTVAKSNNGQSVALQGATLAFTAQVGEKKTRTGLKPGAVVNTSDAGARKAAVLAGVASKVQTESKDGAIAEDVKGRIRQFSSQEPMPTSASQPSLPSTNPQRMAAHLAVGRSAPRTAVHHMPKHSGRTTEQKAQTLGGGNCDNGSISTECQTDDGFNASLTYSKQSDNEQCNENKTPSLASMQQLRSTTTSRIRHGHDEAANLRTSAPPLRSTQEDTQRKPALPPRNPQVNVQNPGKIPTHTLPVRDTGIHTATAMAHLKKPMLPLRRSQSNTRPPTIPSAWHALDDARVASSLASSRAPVLANATPMAPPPQPPPHRRTRSRSLLLPPAPTPRGDNSRIPSPPKSLRQTMRVESKSDNEGERKRSHLSRTRILRPHTQKHGESGRKRWRDKVTERERKRYEGVWAANKGLLLTQELQDMVVNVAVRDIWSRSRLAPRLLGRIWDLVSHDAHAMALSREEFVVGMWLVDQSLQGRRLPWKVPDSVWDSVRQWSITK